MRWILLALLCLLGYGSDAQIKRERGQKKQPIFGAGVIAGVQFTQLDGDNYTGYDLPGLSIGARGVIRLTRRDEVRMELLYSQQGSRVENGTGRTYNNAKERILRLNYAEVPIVFFHQVGRQKQNRGTGFEVGFSYGRLLNFSIEEPFLNNRWESYAEISDRFNSNQLSAVVGLTHRFSSNIEISARSNMGLTRFYRDEEVLNFRPDSIADTLSPLLRRYGFLRNYGIVLRAAYNFL